MSLFKPDFEKEGKGVSKYDAMGQNPVSRFFSVLFGKLFQVVILNFVYLILCAPLVTIGPATAGLTYVFRNMSQGKPVFWFSDFLDKCRQYFKKGLIVELIDAVVIGIAYFAVMFWSDSSRDFATFVRVLAIAVIFYALYMLVCMNFYIFPMMVSFDLGMNSLIRNSLILSSKLMFRNLGMIAFNGAVFALLFLFFPVTLPLILFLPFSICSLFNNSMVFPVLVKYVATPVDEPEENADDDIRIFTDR